MFLSPDLAPPHTSSHKVITKDVQASADQPAPFIHSFEFEDGEESERPNELDMNITTKVEPRD